ncbi:eIF4-gamma/eIF5/eIF2-epsilon family protein [Aphelenchoides avenae]|nr:eIF4-gamma/eIF5/eIF2-epsilon family protein [Aphelenchus avenae]
MGCYPFSKGDVAHVLVGPKGQCEGSTIRNCVVGTGLKVGANGLLEGSIIGDNVVVGDKVHVKPRCIVGPNVKIPTGTVLESGSVLSSAPPPDDDDAIEHQKVHGYYVWKLSTQEDGRFWRDLDRRRSRSSIRSRTQSGNSRGRPSSGGPSAAAALAAESGEKMDAVYGTTQVGVDIFHAEVLESMTQTLRSESYATAEQQKNLILEINSSKLAYNIAMDDVTKHLFLAFLDLPEASESFAGLKKVSGRWRICLMTSYFQLFTEWKVLWTNYYRPKSSQVQMLHALEEHALANEKFLPWLPKVIFLAYNDEELVEEESVLEWYDSLPQESPLRARADLTKLIDWIRESDEEESD